jgi:DNA mismatch endonuclease (patch repair protein)
MADIVSKAKRSEIMSKVRSRGNLRTELAMVKLLRANKITGWRRHYPIVGTPDFVFLKERLAIFVDGCFWHGCPKCFVEPKSNRAFWNTKIRRNKQRDFEVAQKLRKAKWHVLRVWEHQLLAAKKTRLLKTILRRIGHQTQRSWDRMQLRSTKK